MKTRETLMVCAMGAAVAGFGATGANAANITGGLYDLSNHSITDDTGLGHGLVMNKLYSPPGSKKFIFDFDHASSNVQMQYNPATQRIRIFGDVFGGRDFGWYIANDQYAGVYSIDFTYDAGVTSMLGDDDRVVLSTMGANDGTITTPLGDTFTMFDVPDNDGIAFQLGDEHGNVGHRGESGISGWGSMFHDDGSNRFLGSNSYYGEWIFTATPVPTPGAAALALLSGGCLISRRRR